MRPIGLAAALILLASPAMAQGIPTYDNTLNLQQIKQYLQDIKSYVLETQKYTTQLQQYATEVQQYVAFVHDPTLGAAAGLINRAGYGNDLPINPYGVQALTGGYGGLNSIQGILGKIGSLNGLINTNYDANKVYTATDGSFAGTELNARATSIAGMQGVAQAAYQDLRNHQPILQAIKERLATARTPKDVQDAQAALANEQAWTANLHAQLEAVDVNYRASADSKDQRAQEKLHKDLEDFIASAPKG